MRVAARIVVVTPKRALRQAWEDNAASWVTWARTPALDHAFWHLNLPTLLGLLPPPGTGTALDVGCGEGRLAREMKRRGYRVAGLEGSASLRAAALDADPEFEVVLADAAAMPFPDETFDLAVASLALMNMDDMPGAIREVSRVLRRGGAFCFSVLHPINSWGDAGEVSYFETVAYEERIEAAGGEMTFHDTHRPLSDYFAALAAAGLHVVELREPRPDHAYAASHPAARRWRERPGFLHARAVLGERG